MTSRARRLVAAAASTALLGLAVAACSGGGDDDGGNDSSAARSGAEPAYASEAAPVDGGDEDAAGAGSDGAADVAQTSGSGSTSGEVVVDTPADPRSLIKEGNVALTSTDVRTTLGQVKKVLLENRGEVASDDTQADDGGDVSLALLTIRVPVDRYESALDGLKALGTGTKGVKLVSSTSNSQDVSTEVVDTDVRVELQKRSIQRISLLLDRATSLRDIVSIERELATREADLGSLEARQKFLTDQTSLSTITLSVERPVTKEPEPEEKKDETGFAAGLENGWNAFRDVTTGLLTGAGALLPFALLALVVGVPLRVWLRRRQPRPVVGTTDPATSAG